MYNLHKHEIFEIEVLEKLNNARFLEPLVFGGGTMLRLCWGLPRYSVDLDFWFIKKINQKRYFSKLKEYLSSLYELTDSNIKFYSLLFEIRTANYPNRLKIEIRKETEPCDFEQKIAFSPYATRQVALRVHTLGQTLRNKIAAALDRKDIRDCFDIEFLLRQGLSLEADIDKLNKLKILLLSFKERDYKVTLGSLLDEKVRKYYSINKFDYLLAKINEQISK